MPPLQVDQNMLEFFKTTQFTDIILTYIPELHGKTARHTTYFD